MPLQRSPLPKTSAPEGRAGEVGTTIIELTMASALLLVILLTIFSVLDNASASQAYQADRTKSLDENCHSWVSA